MKSRCAGLSISFMDTRCVYYSIFFSLLSILTLFNFSCIIYLVILHINHVRSLYISSIFLPYCTVF